MYEKYWGLEFPPFDESHSAASFVESQELKLARAKLRHVLAHGQGAAAVVGPAGIGKTAMARRLLAEFEAEGWATGFIPAPVGKPEEILLAIAHDLGGCGDNPITALRDAAGELEREGRRACIVIDEAHTLTRMDLLEDLRMLLNIEFSGQAKLSLLMVGQESLPELLRAASGFAQRLALVVRLRAMRPETCKRYILTRLKRAGCSRGLFSKSAAERIKELSSGVPRDINRLCELSLTVGFGFGLEKISREVVNNVARDLGLLREEKPRPRPPEVRAASEQQLERDLALALNAGAGGEDVLAQQAPGEAAAETSGGLAPEKESALTPPEVDDGRGLFSSLAQASGSPAVRTPEGDILSSAAIMEESFLPPPAGEEKAEAVSKARLVQSAPEKIFPADKEVNREMDIFASTEEESAGDILAAIRDELAFEEELPPPPPASPVENDGDEDILAEL